eukprot:6438323-Prorocentrum_lima.AAC.1
MTTLQEVNLAEAIRGEGPKSSWVSHYNTKARDTRYAAPSMHPHGTDGDVTLGSCGCIPEARSI